MAAATDAQELAENLAQHQAQLEQVSHTIMIPSWLRRLSRRVLYGIIIDVESV